MKQGFRNKLCLVIAMVMAFSTISFAAPEQSLNSDLLISEYVEGSSNNKAIEIYNGTGNAVDLSSYKLMKDVNGNGEFALMYQFSGTLEQGKTIVVANSRSTQEILDKSVVGNINFNGDDQVALYKDDNEIDHIGIEGDVDWGKDVTYVRNIDVLDGVTGGVDPRSSDQWTVYTKDTFNHLGLHGENNDEEDDLVIDTITDIAVAKANYVDSDNDYLDDNGPIKIKGIVTETSYSGYTFIQDETGAIALKLLQATELSKGDEIEVMGTVGSSYGFGYMKVEKASHVKLVGSDEVAPTVVALSDVGENYEASLITIENVTIKSGPEYGEYTVESGNENFRIKPKNEDLLEVGTTYESIAGVVYFGYGKYALIPGSSLDIVEDSSRVRPVKASVESGNVNPGTKVELNTLTEDAVIYYTTDSSTPDEKSNEYTSPITISEDTTLKAVAVKEGLTNSNILVIEYDVLENIGTKTISEIQGKSHTSPYNNKNVESVEGIVTAKLNYKFDFTGGSSIKGFYMQDETGDGDDSTSDAIFVRSNADVSIGDKVSVSGLVKEYTKEMDFYAYDSENQLTVTSLEASTIDILSNDSPLPEAVIVGENGRTVPHDKISSDDFSEYDPEKYAIDFYESLEGMRIKIEKPLVVSAEHNRVLSVVPDNGAIAKADGDLSNMGGVILGENDVNTEIIGLNGAIASLGNIRDIDTGATTDGDVVGILDYEWGTYQLYVTEALPTFTNVDREVDTLKFELNEDELTIGSYNVYNHGGDDNEKSLDKAAGIADAMVNGMKSPDIVGLVEVQDNDGSNNSDIVDADKVYQVFIDEIKKLGGPEYKWTDIPPVDDNEGGQPGGNIRVGYLYNPERVSLKEGADKGTSTETVGVDSKGHLTLNPGRIAADASAFDNTRKSLAAEFVFKGKDVIVIANHLSSKGGDNAIYGNIQPAVKYSEVDRIKQAQLINDFVDSVLDKNPNANIVSLGDLNDFHFSKAVKSMAGEGKEKVLENMIDRLPLEEQYTYVYGGNSQVLDNILVSNRLADNTRVDVININSIISDKDKARRHSDHDPVMVSIKLKEEDKPDNSHLKDIYISKLDISNYLTGDDTTVFAKNDFIRIDAGFTPYKESVKDAAIAVTLYRVTKKGEEIPVYWNMQSNLPVDMNGRIVQMGLSTYNLSKGNYRLKYEVYNTTDGICKLSDEATAEIKIVKKSKGNQGEKPWKVQVQQSKW